MAERERKMKGRERTSKRRTQREEDGGGRKVDPRRDLTGMCCKSFESRRFEL